MNATQDNEGMVYRGRTDRVHIADGKRAEMGEAIAHELTDKIRREAYWDAFITAPEGMPAGEAHAIGANASEDKPLCPGCYMTALFNMAVTLAKENGQSLTELGNTMAGEFARLAAGGEDRVESVRVIRDGSCRGAV